MMIVDKILKFTLARHDHLKKVTILVHLDAKRFQERLRQCEDTRNNQIRSPSNQ